MTDEEKNSMELDIEAKYVGRTEKEFLNTITYAECLYILDTKNKYCDDIKTLSLLKIVDIVNEQSKEIEELNLKNEKLYEDNLTLAQEIKEFIEGTNDVKYYSTSFIKNHYISKDKLIELREIDNIDLIQCKLRKLLEE